MRVDPAKGAAFWPGAAAEPASADVLVFCVPDGDPLPDVGRPPLLHSEAALVEVPGHLGLLLCCHSLCHLPSYKEASSTDNPKVRVRRGEEPGLLSSFFKDLI